MLTACESSLDISKTKEYSKNGIHFTLPAQWDVTEDEDDEGFRYIVVEDSDVATLIINSYPTPSAPTLNDYVNDMIETSVADLTIGSREKGAISEISTTIGAQVFVGIQNSFTITLFGVEVPFTANFYDKKSDSQVVHIMSQAPTEDLADAAPGFELILASFSLD